MATTKYLSRLLIIIISLLSHVAFAANVEYKKFETDSFFLMLPKTSNFLEENGVKSTYKSSRYNFMITDDIKFAISIMPTPVTLKTIDFLSKGSDNITRGFLAGVVQTYSKKMNMENNKFENKLKLTTNITKIFMNIKMVNINEKIYYNYKLTTSKVIFDFYVFKNQDNFYLLLFLLPTLETTKDKNENKIIETILASFTTK